jgi:hypothetical protein
MCRKAEQLLFYAVGASKFQGDNSQTFSSKKTKLNSLVWVLERTIPTEQPPLIGEVSTNFCG